jgi:G2/mitotic-specific cyclin 3/4
MATNSHSFGLNAAAKRTVFGDVSNTAHALAEPAPKDKDFAKPRIPLVSSRADKKQTTTTDKETGSQGGAFLRPPQRALGPLPGHNTSTAPKPPAHVEMPLVKPTASKKATFVYSDEQNNNISKMPSYASFAPTNAISAVEKRVKNPRHFKSQPQLRTGPQMNPAVSRVTDKHSNSAGELILLDRPEVRREVYQPAQPRPINPVQPPTQRHELDNNNQLNHIDDGASDAPYEDALENLASLSSSIETEIFTKQEQDQEPYHETGYNRQVSSEYEHHHNVLAEVPRGHNDALATSVNTEPEENWDGDEDDGDYYEEQGYTTAHSYTHGENTTGGVTVIVAPKVTAKVRSELELARIHVEQHMTPDQIEEECWDTSMVAEYGEEIFEYMRSIEVSST